jgi:hypothetical protein
VAPAAAQGRAAAVEAEAADREAEVAAAVDKGLGELGEAAAWGVWEVAVALHLKTRGRAMRGRAMRGCVQF